MGRRNVYGNDWSENGWPMVDQGSCTWVQIPGTDVWLEIANDALPVMRAFAADFHVNVEPLRNQDSACWTEGNSVATSNHLSGTAMDLNWDSHPFHASGTYGQKYRALRDLLDWYEGMIFWGGDWQSPIDEMHFQIGYNTYNSPALKQFIATNIRDDGFSIYKRGSAPSVDTAQLLSDVMGGSLSLDRYSQLVSDVAASLAACECTTVNRIAMWVAQIGHESGGLKYTEEIASGAAYEGRIDLGNTQPGDGVRFKGRSWIQITGRNNYTQLSQWAFAKGLVPSSTYFVDNPADLAEDQYAGLGAAWYWVVARPDINSLSDAKDIQTVTQRINGGENGIDDRINRYNNALAHGDDLLSLLAVSSTLEDLLMSDTKYSSLSIYATPGEGAKYTIVDLIRSIDGMTHRNMVEHNAMYGDVDDLDRVAAVAAGKGAVTDAADIKHAQAVLAWIEQERPNILKAYMAAKGVS